MHQIFTVSNIIGLVLRLRCNNNDAIVFARVVVALLLHSATERLEAVAQIRPIVDVVRQRANVLQRKTLNVAWKEQG